MAGERPLRLRRGNERGPGAGVRRGELAAGLATAAVAGQFLVAQPTLVAAAALIALGRLLRWRPHWLAAAAAGTVIWLWAIGPAAAVAAFLAGSQRQAAYVLAAAFQRRPVAHLYVAAAGIGRWPPTGLPIALLAACGEAWLVLWLGWWRPNARWQSQWRWRPGLVAWARRRMSAAALGAGHTATRHGCAIGVATDTGTLASFSWADAEHGVLLAGDEADVLGMSITAAALSRRKTVVVLDCAGRAAVTERVGHLARSLGAPVTAAAGGAALTGSIGRAIRSRETVLITTKAPNSAQRAATDLAGVLADLRDLGLRADCLVWIEAAEFIDRVIVAELLAAGPLTGAVVVLGTMSSVYAADLVSAVGVVAVGCRAGTDVWQALASAQPDGGDRRAAVRREVANAAALRPADPSWRPIALPREVTLLTFPPGRDGALPAITNCRVVPIKQDVPQ